MEHITALLTCNWIEECGGPWGSLIVLAPKPHQEHITSINDFVWRMCVSYRPLNAVTKPFTYPIPLCDNAVSVFGMNSSEPLHFISLDAKQGYHQISVKASDKEKLAFFAPNRKKYTFNVMPFGPTNAPAFYTCMMYKFQSEWDQLFRESVLNLQSTNKSISVSADNIISVSGQHLIIGSKVIIDDILAFSNFMKFLLIYFECICKIFQKYHVSFQLKK